MSQYDKFDALVLERLSGGPMGFDSLHRGDIRQEGSRLAEATGNSGLGYLVLGRRLQALRKAGKIRFDSKRGWMIVKEPD